MPLKPSTNIGNSRTAPAVSMLLALVIVFSTLPCPVLAASSPTALSIKNAQNIIVKPNPPALLPVVDQPDIQLRDRIIADSVLRALPAFCRHSLRNFYVTYDKNPKNRGLGGESTIIVRRYGVPDNEFRALIVHECGHVADLGGLRGSSNAGPSAFVDGTTPIFNNDPSVAFYSISWNNATRIKSRNDAHFVSGYAKTDPFEDYAETFAFYALQQKEFARLATKNPVLKAKYDYMANTVFVGSSQIAEGNAIRGVRAPWDVTKLPYTWHAKR